MMLWNILNQLNSINYFAVGGKDLVMFYADWCPFCQRFKPLFESVAGKSSSTTNSYKMYGAKVNDDDNPLWINSQ